MSVSWVVRDQTVVDIVREDLTECSGDRYPPKMIPGIDIICCTTATNDRDARLLLSALGVPFQGKHVNY